MYMQIYMYTFACVYIYLHAYIYRYIPHLYKYNICIFICVYVYMAFPGGVVVRNLPANAGDTKDTSSVPGLARFPGEGNGNPLSILAWRIPWTEPGGLQSTGLQRGRHN